MVLVTMVQVVSPFWKYWLCVVIDRVTLQLVSPNAVPNAVSAAMSTETMILIICCLVIALS